jgi:hypothetical protein
MFTLFQNTPNPFGSSTTIGFNLPEDAFTVLTVSDVSGKILKEFKGNYRKGYNEISFERPANIVSGVYIYRIESGSFTAWKKMALID